MCVCVPLTVFGRKKREREEMSGSGDEFMHYKFRLSGDYYYYHNTQ